MKAPFFSIVTVVYNAEKVVAGTAASLRDQTFTDYEWIVVDGASRDGTLDAVRPYFVEGRDIVISEPDRGVYDAMNKGLRAARGTVVQFLNAGDLLENTEVLQRVAAEFEEGVDAVYGDTIFQLADGLTIAIAAWDAAERIDAGMPMTHQALFTRTALHRAHAFDLRYRIAADYAAIAAMYRAHARMKRVAFTININTIEPEAISIAGKAQGAADYFRVQRDILGVGMPPALCRFMRQRAIIFVVRMLQSLPRPVYEILPKTIRRRVY